MRFILLVLVLFANSCFSNTTEIKIETKSKELIVKKVNINAKNLYIATKHKVGGFASKFYGMEKLKNIENLYIGYGIYDFSFIEKLPKLQLLMLDGTSPPIDFSFLTKLKNLKILYVYGVILKDSNLNLKMNSNLEFLALNSIMIKENPFYLKLENIPNRVTYIDLSSNVSLRINSELLESLLNVPNVFISKKLLTKQAENIFNKNDNFSDNNDLIPEIYNSENLYEKFGMRDGGYIYERRDDTIILEIIPEK